MKTLNSVLNRGVSLMDHGVPGKPTTSPVYSATRKERAQLKKDLRANRIQWRDVSNAQSLVEFGYFFA